MKTKKDTKDLLLEITFDEVYTYGYQGASVLKILEKAGLNKGSLYHYFKNKKFISVTNINDIIPWSGIYQNQKQGE